MSDTGQQPDRDRPSLSSGDAEALTETLADLSVAGAPLVDGLRAAANEASSNRMASELRWLAFQLESGRPLEDVMQFRRGLPSYVAGLVRAGVRTGQLGEVLVELVDHQRAVRELWRSIRSALAYPVLLLTLALAIGLWIEFGLVGAFLDMYEEFDMDLPYVTQVLEWGYRVGGTWLLVFVVTAAIGTVVFRLAGGAARWRRVIATVPLIGVLWHWTGVSELTRLLAALLAQRVPLPEALRLAADGVHDANVGQVSRMLADGVEQGQSLSELLDSTYRLPATLVPIVRWGERSGELSEAFRLAGEMYEGRVRMRSELVISVVPPLIIVTVAMLAMVIIVGLYAPMFSMIQGLAG
jgi:general secretion pathway protein F